MGFHRSRAVRFRRYGWQPRTLGILSPMLRGGHASRSIGKELETIPCCSENKVIFNNIAIRTPLSSFVFETDNPDKAWAAVSILTIGLDPSAFVGLKSYSFPPLSGMYMCSSPNLNWRLQRFGKTITSFFCPRCQAMLLRGGAIFASESNVRETQMDLWWGVWGSVGTGKLRRVWLKD